MQENKKSQKAIPNQPATWYQTIIDLGSKGVSNKTIATKLGISIADFYLMLEYEENGEKPIQRALEEARAEFELSRVHIKDEILGDPETSKGLKYKIVREDLKTLEDWAPAQRSVKVTVEQAPTGFTFESFTIVVLVTQR